MAEGKNRSWHTRQAVYWVAISAALMGAVVFFGTKLGLQARLVGRGPFQLVGKEAPDIQFRYSSGEQASFHEGRGKVFLVNFWASWCEPCMAEMPSLTILEKHFSSQGLMVLAFNIGEEESVVRGRLQGKDFPRHLIFSFDRAQLRPYALTNLPISILIGRDGTVRRVYEGARNWAELDHIREIEAELK